MGIDDSRQWLFVSLQQRGHPWTLRVDDATGERVAVRWRDRRSLEDAVARRIDEVPPRGPSPEGWHPRVPVFYRSATHGPDVGEVVRAALQRLVDDARVQVVEAPGGAAVARGPFALPFDVVAIGREARRATDALRDEHWLHLPQVADHGFRVRPMPFATYAWQHRARGDIDVVVCDAETAEKVIRAVPPRTGPTTAPRVVVAIEATEELRRFARRRIRRGLAVVFVPANAGRARTAGFLRDLGRNLVHDLALHDAVAAAAARNGLQGPHAPDLICDPSANWSLAISDAYRSITERGRVVDAVLARFVRPVDPVTPALAAFTTLDRLSAPTSFPSIAAIRPEFEQETSGLVPLAVVDGVLDGIAEELRPLARELAPLQDRRVDLCVDRTRPAGTQTSADRRYPMRVDRRTTLAARTTYLVTLQIGAAFVGSVFAERPPPIDALLPPSPGGRRLEIAAVGLELEIEGPAVRSLVLPAVGASTSVTFRIRTAGVAEVARARFLVTYLDHVLQSFVLQAAVSEGEERRPEEVLRARVEHIASSRFENLERLGARGAALVANDDPAGATHSLAIKRGDGVASWRFGDDEVAAIVAEVRRILTDATGSVAPRFPEPPPADDAGVAARAKHFEQAIRELAQQGAQLYRATFVRASDCGDALLGGLRRNRDLAIQIVQVSASLVLPWNVVYDWRVPNDLADVATLPVCRGFMDDEAEVACGHDEASDGVVCCRGFWGVRHRLESRLAEHGGGDTVDEITAHRADAVVRVGLGKSVQGGAGLAQGFQALLGAPSVRIAPRTDACDVLWSAERPAIFVALGHFASKGTGTLRKHEIDLDPPLHDGTIANRARNDGRWNAPHTLVLLMACSSTTTPLDALVGMTRALLGARAGGVVGTETNVFSGLASHVADQVRAGLLDDPRRSLGEVLQRVRQRLVAGRSPLAFTFVSYGNADLKVGTAATEGAR